MADKAPKLADYVTVAAVQNGSPGECIVRCRIEGCRWQAHSLTRRLAAELAAGHIWADHRIKVERSPSPAPQRATVRPNPYAATLRRLAGLA